MTYIYRALRDAPSGLWSLDSLPLQDSSGYGNDAATTGAPTTTLPIVAGGISSQHLRAGDSINYPVGNFMVASRPSRAFTLEAWVKPSSGNHTILARNTSGLFIEGSKLRFTLDVGVPASVEYVGIKSGNVYHVVGIYDIKGVNLFVNGERVAGLDVDPGVFADLSENLVSVTSSSLVIDSVAVYPFSLAGEVVRAHYAWGVDYPEVVTLSALNGGTYYEFTDDRVSGLLAKTTFPESGWSSGIFGPGAASISDRIVNLYSETDGQYQSGTWTYQESFEDSTETIVGSRIVWNSNADIVVESSEDGGVTWETLSNGERIIYDKTLTGGYSVSVRVSIPASVEQIAVDSLSIAFYSSMNILGSDEDLPATVLDPSSTTLSETYFPPASFNDNIGVKLEGASAGLSIPGDPEFGGYFAVEMTVKLEGESTNSAILWVDMPSAQPQIFSDGSGLWNFSNLDALYVDGLPVSSPANITTDEWHHIIAVFPESLATFYVGNNPDGAAGFPMRVGHLATYSDPVSAEDALSIYNAWTGAPTHVFVDGNVINVREPVGELSAQPFKGYAFDWAIITGG